MATPYFKIEVDTPFGQMLFVIKADSEVMVKAQFEMWNNDTFGRGALNDRGRIIGAVKRSSKKATAGLNKYAKVIKEEIYFKNI